MSFYAQLDSINDEFCVADVGLIQVFVCFEHSEVMPRWIAARTRAAISFRVHCEHSPSCVLPAWFT